MPRDLQRFFRAEARDLIDRLESGFERLDGGDNQDVLKELLRLAHTLKGAARVAGHAPVATTVHQLEEILPHAAAGHADVLARGRTLIAALAEEVAALERKAASEPGTRQTSETLPRPAAPPSSGMLRVDPDDLLRLEQQVNNIRVELGELRRSVPALGPIVADVDELHATLDGVRLLPFGVVEEHLSRSAADAASSLGKQVDLRVRGGDVRLELQVLESIRDGLIQAVRNAVVHGIEDAADRIASGKPGRGSIDVSVENTGGLLVFTCRDDGRGIDLPLVRQMLVRGQWLTPTEGRTAPDEDILQALLRHHVSSRSTASVHAGRGVGLDVVRAAAARLNGSARLATEAGSGTTVEMTVPASVSSLSALLVESVGQQALLPLDRVRQVVKIRQENLTHAAAGTTVLVDGEEMPWACLGEILGVEGSATDPEPYAVVVGSDSGRAALGTAMPGVVLTAFARRLPSMSAASRTVRAVAELDGGVVPVLDIDRVAVASRHARARPSPARARRTPRILIVDDSITTRMLEQSILEAAGYTVDTAASGEEALGRLEAARYDAMVVDVEMPGISGFDLLERARDTPRIADVPAVLVTSRDSAADRARGQAAGARAYFVKSAFDQDRLLATIGRLVR